MITKLISKGKKLFNPHFWLFKWQRNIVKLPLRKLSVNIVKSLIGNRPAKGVPFLPIDNTAEHIQNLQKNGFSKLGQILTQDQVAEIRGQLDKLQCHDPYDVPTGPFNIAQAPSTCHVANYRRDDLVKNNTIIKIANDAAILKIVQEILGATPTISNINCWWSLAGRAKAEHAQLFHRDVDDFKFLKLFVYLTDVANTDGPHVYVAGSHNINEATKIKRYQDDEIAATFGKENIVSFEEPKGSIFLVDTFGVHKGMLPQLNNRLLLQIQYSLLPLYVESYKPTVSQPDAGIDAYANRLLFDYVN